MNIDKQLERVAKLQAEIEREQKRALAIGSPKAATKLTSARDFAAALESAKAAVDALEDLAP